MGIIGSLVKTIKSSVTGQRQWTPEEVRELITSKSFEEAITATENLSPHVVERQATQHCLLGEIFFHQQRDEHASIEFEVALKLMPGCPEAHYGLSLLAAEKSEIEDALRHAHFSVNGSPKEGRFLAQLGYCQLRSGNLTLAETNLRRASFNLPGQAYVWTNLGIALRAKGDLGEAHQCFSRALRLAPKSVPAQEHLQSLERETQEFNEKLPIYDVRHTLTPQLSNEISKDLQEALGLQKSGLLKEAIERCEGLLITQTDDPNVPMVLSQLYVQAGESESAADVLLAYLDSHPNDLAVSGALGLIYLNLMEHKNAENYLLKTNAAETPHLDYVIGLAQAITGQGRFFDSETYLRSAINLSFGKNPKLKALLAANLANQCRYSDAMSVIDELRGEGLKFQGEQAILIQLGKYAEALTALDQQIAQQPNEPRLRFERATLHLLLGNFELGWRDYGMRGLANATDLRLLPFPMWNGEDLSGKQIIVLAEQGLGDQIMFSSCIPDLLKLDPKRVILEANTRVSQTLSQSFPDCTVVATRQDSRLDWVKNHPDTDYFIPIADLAVHFRTSLARFPAHNGYIKCLPERVDYWRSQLKARGPGPYIGVSWRGGLELTRRPLRSVSLQSMEPILQAIPATWVCLQYGDVLHEVDDHNACSDVALHYWPGAIQDLCEFGALVAALDLVISVCNTTVHYAGGLGRPVWVLAPKVPEWRYGIEGNSLPWYPSAKIFRQAVSGEWAPLIATIATTLAEHQQSVGLT